MNQPDSGDLCIGVCSADPESGKCMGCGYPLFPVTTQAVACAESSRSLADSDNPKTPGATAFEDYSGS